MAQKSETPNQQNISEVLEMLKRSYNNDVPEERSEPETAKFERISDEELQEKLKIQFSSSLDTNTHTAEDSYYIDEDFLAEAELCEESEDLDDNAVAEEVLEGLTDELEEEKSELILDDFENIEEEFIEVLEEDTENAPQDEVTEDITVVENIIEDAFEEELDNDIELHSEEITEEIDEDITFDELEIYADEDDGIEFTKLELEEPELDEELTFDQIEEIDDAEENIVFMHLDLEPLEESMAEAETVADEAFTEDTEVYEDIPMRIPEKAIMREFAPMSIAELEASLENADAATCESVDQLTNEIPEEQLVEAPEAVVDGDFLEELFADDAHVAQVSDVSAIEKLAKNESDGAEISLLMQFGCDDEIIDRYAKENEAAKTDENAEVTRENERKEQLEALKKKVTDRCEDHKNRSYSIYIRLALVTVFAFLLLLYEGLPAAGIELPGILNRDDYYISYVLIGLQLVVLCVLTSYKQLWSGAKRLLASAPNAYSIAFVLCAVILPYDICILFAGEDVTPHTFHFLLSLVLISALLCELKLVNTEQRCLEFFFSDILRGEEEDEQKKFTLRKSEGKNSAAEKMYRGGLDASQSIHYPVDIDSARKFFDISGGGRTKSSISMFLFIPIAVLSLLIGIFALIVSGEVWIGMGGVTITLFLALPVASMVAFWLPFERIIGHGAKNGYAFANEAGLDNYANCDIMVFSDLHLFERCQPSKVNLALYDATSNDVLLGCLNAVYSKIGGPMSSAFAAAENKKLGECRITRVAKIGVEAIVGNNYSVLLGTEGFMSRYGISFPNASLNNKEDEVFTLCVSINGRASARIAVRYNVSKMFEMFVERLEENGIGCAIETFDPMINAEMLDRIKPNGSSNISIIHMSAEDIIIRSETNREKILFEASNEELQVMARGSRFSLAVALCSAKKMKKLSKLMGLISVISCGIGALMALAAAGFGWIYGFSGAYILLYWMVSLGGLLALIFKLLPHKNDFSFERYMLQQEFKNQENDQK